jgi:hypothetical protein
MVKVFIGTPTKWGINPYTHLSWGYNMGMLWRHTDYEFMYPRMYDEAPIDEARNVSVEDFKKSDADLFLTYDADQVFPPGVLLRLFKTMEVSNKPIVGGWYLARKGTGTVVVFKRATRRELGNFNNFSSYEPYSIKELLTQTKSESTPYGRLLYVDGVGFGLMLIKREVFEKMKYPYFLQWSPAMNRDIQRFGEDLWFADQCAIHNIPICINAKCFIGHWAAQGYVVADDHLLAKASMEGFTELVEAINKE